MAKETNIEFIKRFNFADSKIPEFKKVYGSGLVKYGTNGKDDYGDYLLNLYNKSAKHNAIINGKVVYILGNGLSVEDETNAAALSFLSKANDYDEDWNEIIKKCVLDIEVFGGFYLQCVPKNGGGFNYFHVAFNSIRTNEFGSEFYYKKNWKDYKEQQQEFVAFKRTITDKPTIFAYKEYRAGYSIYPLPSWVACCNLIESDIEVSKAILTKSATGFNASKLISLFNGEPDENGKKNVEQRIKNKFTGAEGDTLMVTFNADKSQAPEVLDLGASDLTKEDFSKIDNIITNGIFAGHSVTHPLLFGIQQEGKLGNSSELKIAFDIFKNTYANAKQKSIEALVDFFANCNGVVAKFKIKDIEPVGVELNIADFKELLPKEWVLEKFGIDLTKYGIEPTPQPTTQQASTNNTITNLSGRQMQNISRVVRQFTQGKLTKEQAAIMLKSGFNFSDEDVNAYLGIDDDPTTNDATKQALNSQEDLSVSLMFNDGGVDRQHYTVLKSVSFLGDDSIEVAMAFDAAIQLNDLEQQVKDMLQNNPKLTIQEIAQATNKTTDIIDAIFKKFIDNKIIEVGKNNAIKVVVKTPKFELPKIEIFYTYEKRKDVGGVDVLPTTRPFCKRMVQLSNTKMWSRKEIQNISQKLGYNVFLRAGGFWNNNGNIEYHCRHEWVANAVIKK